jgi:2-polyprenyl-6-hydroxyphenyl methylase/3-demethylubiquinone-9 3-methyltransferase
MTVAIESERFAFGENWRKFVDVISESRIVAAEQSLREMLQRESLAGRRFLDIGCGSGLFSLAARRLGADVYSFDFDPMSVRCAEELKRRFFRDDPGWQIAQGSVLDAAYLESLGHFDVVYSWGVLHHTGSMWTAIENATDRVKPGGQLFIAIYNDQGVASVWWTRVKRTYNRLPAVLKKPYLLLFGAALEAGAVGMAVVRMQPQRLLDRWTRYENVRGMSRWHDIVDWVGGYPFEVATPEAIIDFCLDRGFVLRRLKTCGGKMGCNEFVLTRTAD